MKREAGGSGVDKVGRFSSKQQKKNLRARLEKIRGQKLRLKETRDRRKGERRRWGVRRRDEVQKEAQRMLPYGSARLCPPRSAQSQAQRSLATGLVRCYASR
jgi:hypothetical protein